MDLRDHLLALVGSPAIGDELAPGIRLVRASTELGLRLSVTADGAAIDVEITPADAGGRHAARTDRLLFGYRSGGAVTVDPAAGQAVCAALAAVARRHEAAALARIADDARAVAATDAPRVREVTIDRLLEPAGPPHQRHDTLSPYVGCLIGCRFCYAQSRLTTLRRLAGLPAAPWGSWVDVRVNAPAILAAELVDRPPRPVKFCPIVSDPYHAIEARLGLTRRCLEVLAAADAPPPTLILTRAVLIARDADVLARLPAWVGMSVPTFDDDVRAHFEPRGAPIAARLATLRALRAAGVTTCAVAQPMLPGPVEALADALADAVSSVSLDVLRGEEAAGPLFDDPRHRHARDDAWQRAQADALADALTARGVAVWPGELPAELTGEPTSAG
ncbi:MAG: hypothetical protein H6709_20225 [Kofleriaceae bacterium]|nr:hypothetical protein [Kofleriaceae bacterium]